MGSCASVFSDISLIISTVVSQLRVMPFGPLHSRLRVMNSSHHMYEMNTCSYEGVHTSRCSSTDNKVFTNCMSQLRQCISCKLIRLFQVYGTSSAQKTLHDHLVQSSPAETPGYRPSLQELQQTGPTCGRDTPAFKVSILSFCTRGSKKKLDGSCCEIKLM